MGYQLHITRAETPWEDGHIPREEWLRYVADDPELEVSETDYAEDRKGHREYDVVWNAAPPNESQRPPLWYSEGRIQTKYPSDAFVEKLKTIAKQLNARVLGDDGELYP
jgi:hypothetical protein